MKCWLALFLIASSVSTLAFGREESVLVRVTVYWRDGRSGQRAQWNGALLRSGHCAVDPKKIPFGSKVIFADGACVAVDSGPDVVSRKAARRCGRTARERKAIVVDRFFENRQQALAWARTHAEFITVRVVTSEVRVKQLPTLAKAMRHDESSIHHTTDWPWPMMAARSSQRGPAQVVPNLRESSHSAVWLARRDAMFCYARRRTGAEMPALLVPDRLYDDSFA
jgi:3D (Asp-Asp-Asp) domain-containing protein